MSGQAEDSNTGVVFHSADLPLGRPVGDVDGASLRTSRCPSLESDLTSLISADELWIDGLPDTPIDIGSDDSESEVEQGAEGNQRTRALRYQDIFDSEPKSVIDSIFLLKGHIESDSNTDQRQMDGALAAHANPDETFTWTLTPAEDQLMETYTWVCSVLGYSSLLQTMVCESRRPTDYDQVLGERAVNIIEENVGFVWDEWSNDQGQIDRYHGQRTLIETRLEQMEADYDLNARRWSRTYLTEDARHGQEDGSGNVPDESPPPRSDTSWDGDIPAEERLLERWGQLDAILKTQRNWFTCVHPEFMNGSLKPLLGGNMVVLDTISMETYSDELSRLIPSLEDALERASGVARSGSEYAGQARSDVRQSSNIIDVYHDALDRINTTLNRDSQGLERLASEQMEQRRRPYCRVPLLDTIVDRGSPELSDATRRSSDEGSIATQMRISPLTHEI